MPSEKRAGLAMFIVASALTFPADAFAGAWAQPENTIYAKLSYAKSSATRQYKGSGGKQPLLTDDIPGSFDGDSVGLYVEYGLLPKLTVFGTTQVMSSELDSDIERAEVRGLGDVLVGARYQVLDAPLVLAVSSSFKAPTGYAPDHGLLRPTLGNGVPEADLRLLVGKSFYPVPMYFSAEAGFRWRGDRPTPGGTDTVDFSNELPYSAELGYQVALKNKHINWLLFRGALNGVWGLGDPSELNALSLTPPTQRFTKVGPSVIFGVLNKLELNIDYMYTVAGDNTLESHDVFVGLAIKTTL